jgi:hypothetical protein
MQANICEFNLFHTIFIQIQSKFDGFVAGLRSIQTSKQANKQTSKQANKQTSKQAKVISLSHAAIFGWLFS